MEMSTASWHFGKKAKMEEKEIIAFPHFHSPGSRPYFGWEPGHALLLLTHTFWSLMETDAHVTNWISSKLPLGVSEIFLKISIHWISVIGLIVGCQEFRASTQLWKRPLLKAMISRGMGFGRSGGGAYTFFNRPSFCTYRRLSISLEPAFLENQT